jgi:hypothetical protein
MFFSLLGVQVQQALVFGPILGGNPDHHVSILLLQVFDSERGLLPLLSLSWGFLVGIMTSTEVPKEDMYPRSP